MSEEPPADWRENSTGGLADPNVPVAPYPPMISARFPSHHLRSSLSHSPHYTSPTPSFIGSRAESNVSGTSSLFPGYATNVGGASTATSLEDGGTADEASRQTNAFAVTDDSAAIANIEFCRPDLLACINCVSSSSNTHTTSNTPTSLNSAKFADSTTPARSNRKMGPVLLELRKLQLNEGTHGNHDFFTTSQISVSRGNPSLGMSMSSTCLHVSPQAMRTSENALHRPPPPIATGLTTGALCVHTFVIKSDGDNENNQDWTPNVEYYHTPRHHRASTAVQWRPTTVRPQHVAIGLLSASSSGSHPTTNSVVPGRRGVSGGVGVAASVGLGGRSASTGDKDYCCFVWDVEHQSASRRTKTSPIYKLSHQSGVASLGWLMGGETLAIGGQLRHVQLYDLREATTSAPMTVMAHNFAVHGIVPDPHKSWQFATYSRVSNEPVKIWDCRRMDTNLTEIKIPSQSISPSSVSGVTPPVSQVHWSPLEAGFLSVAVGDAIYEFDTTTPASRPIHVNTMYARGSVLDVALYPFVAEMGTAKEASVHKLKAEQRIPTLLIQEDAMEAKHLEEMKLNHFLEKRSVRSNQRILGELYPNRMMVVYTDRSLHDFPRHTIAPLAVSSRDGRLVHSIGRTLWVGSSRQGPAAIERLTAAQDEDVSAVMLRRARCIQSINYSMDPSANIQILAHDGSGVDSLLRLWSWIERVEVLCSSTETDDGWDDGMSWPAKTLMDAGAWRLLHIAGCGEGEIRGFSEHSCCSIYDSPGRRAALTSCGWAGRFDLSTVMGECEELGEYERSAALAVWHDDIGAAVDCLQRGASVIRQQMKRGGESVNMYCSSEHAETLDLVSFCVAGHRGDSMDSPASGIWRRTCATLMKRSSFSGQSRCFAYVRGMLKFLMTSGSDQGHDEVLLCDDLSLCDRVGFACRFLSWNELLQYLETCIVNCQRSGDIEGMIITGLEKEGIKILQSFVDRTADVQSAALITSRVIFPVGWNGERRASIEWLESYRSLLNTWQMWQSRALFDVDRADLLRKVKSRQFDASGKFGSVPISRRQVSAGGKPGLRQPDPDIQATIPAQLDARCNYCSAPLSLKLKDTHANQWLSKMKPVLPCCAQCRKPLPHCAICMLSLGTLNPYMELTKDRSGRSSRSGLSSLQTADDMSSLGNLPFAEWFTWCLRCKHGGHAHHLVGWFAKHEVCPVSGCDCHCQFDGIHELNRYKQSSERVTNENEQDTTSNTEAD